jgi:hypothetical protein
LYRAIVGNIIVVGVLHLRLKISVVESGRVLTLRMTSNIKSLTQSHKVIRAKKKQKREQLPAIVFDEDARKCVYISFAVSVIAGV